MTRRSTLSRRQQVRGKPAERQKWAVEQFTERRESLANLGLSAHVTFSGALAWPYVYPWPQRAPGLIETAFAELGRRWRPILDAFDAVGCDVCYEIHPGEDLFDGATFERFLEAVGGHQRCAINYDPSHFFCSNSTISSSSTSTTSASRAFHVKDAEFNPTGRQGVYSGYASWVERAGRFRSLGDGQVDFGAIFSKMAQYGYSSLGGAGVGMLFETSRGRRARRR